MFREKWGGGKESGFTMIELLIAIAIVSVLAAIAIPQYVHYKERAHDSETKHTLRNLLLACRIYWEDNGGSNSCDITVASSPEYGFVDPVDVNTGGSGNETSFSATAQHMESANTFTINNAGAIN